MQVERIVRNLLDNAIKYGGTGAVRLAVTTGSDVTITVSDTGPGIALAERARVFEEFYRTNSAGQPGLGLGDVGGRLHPAALEGHAGSPIDSSRPNIRLRFWTACEEVPL